MTLIRWLGNTAVVVASAVLLLYIYDALWVTALSYVKMRNIMMKHAILLNPIVFTQIEILYHIICDMFF